MYLLLVLLVLVLIYITVFNYSLICNYVVLNIFSVGIAARK